MKYTIKLGGRGADFYIHDITDEQRDLLKEGNVESDNMEYDDIAEILGKENLEETDQMVTGVYDNPSDMVIEVRDEEGNLIFDSTTQDNWYFDDDRMIDNENFEFVHEGGNKLFVESYSKGNFFEFELECEEFDPKKLSPKQVEVGESFDLITGLYYDGQELKMDYDDYWSKGYYYYLS